MFPFFFNVFHACTESGQKVFARVLNWKVCLESANGISQEVIVLKVPESRSVKGRVCIVEVGIGETVSVPDGVVVANHYTRPLSLVQTVKYVAFFSSCARFGQEGEEDRFPQGRLFSQGRLVWSNPFITWYVFCLGPDVIGNVEFQRERATIVLQGHL